MLWPNKRYEDRTAKGKLKEVTVEVEEKDRKGIFRNMMDDQLALSLRRAVSWNITFSMYVSLDML